MQAREGRALAAGLQACRRRWWQRGNAREWSTRRREFNGHQGNGFAVEKLGRRHPGQVERARGADTAAACEHRQRGQRGRRPPCAARVTHGANLGVFFPSKTENVDASTSESPARCIDWRYMADIFDDHAHRIVLDAQQYRLVAGAWLQLLHGCGGVLLQLAAGACRLFWHRVSFCSCITWERFIDLCVRVNLARGCCWVEKQSDDDDVMIVHPIVILCQCASPHAHSNIPVSQISLSKASLTGAQINS